LFRCSNAFTHTQQPHQFHHHHQTPRWARPSNSLPSFFFFWAGKKEKRDGLRQMGMDKIIAIDLGSNLQFLGVLKRGDCKIHNIFIFMTNLSLFSNCWAIRTQHPLAIVSLYNKCIRKLTDAMRYI
jgi:hypothetical protein